jgi:hypothetical protein
MWNDAASLDSEAVTSKPLLGVQVMRRTVPLALAAAVVGLAASASQAAITLSVNPAPNFLNATGTAAGTVLNINPALAAAGWSAYVITLTPDASSKVVTVEFANDLQAKGGIIGISGNVHQTWVIDPDTGTTNPTPIGLAATSGVNPANTSSGGGRDSYFLNSGYYTVSVATPFQETNNLANGANPPYTVSPLADIPDTRDFGVGTLLKFTGAADPAGVTAGASVNIAYIIAPTDGSNPNNLVVARGYALDLQNNAFFFNVPVNAPIPEPASLGVLALGGLALLARRRRA